ncbi:MAG TPA: hypothetical protein VJY39_21255 [Acidisphaera sp.]|nr:hypothetical protein [Acidisphaera sp.]
MTKHLTAQAGAPAPVTDAATAQSDAVCLFCRQPEMVSMHEI